MDADPKEVTLMLRFGRLAVMAALVVALSACVNGQQHLTVHPDGTADVASTVLIDNSVLTTNGQTVDGALQTMKIGTEQREGQSVRTIKGPKQSGLEITNHFKTLDTALYFLSNPTTGQNLFSKATVDNSGNWFRSTRKFTFDTESTAVGSDASMDDPGQPLPPQMSASAVDVTFSLTLPETISSANQGGKITDDGHTVTWDMPLDRTMTFQTEATSGPPAWFWGLVSAVGVIIIAGIGTLLFVRYRGRQPAGARPRAGQA